ncbi:MAG: ATP-binding protein [Bacteroidales bacterium]|jgi:hypothetical protein
MLTKVVIEQIVESQQERLKKIDSGLPRTLAVFDQPGSNALIVSGIRRCGKSTLLQQIRERSGEPSVYLNFEDPRLAGFDLQDFNRLHEIAEKSGVFNYYFDEIQEVDQWESFVRFRLDEGYRIFITGSNATLLSKELGTKLTGRHISKELFPFSYPEYLLFSSQKSGKVSLISYLDTGGFPEYLKTGITDILMQTFNDILIRDITLRYNLKNISLIQQLGVWLVSNTGKLFTGNSLRKLFQINSSSTVMEYLSYFANAWLFFYVPRFSYSLKVQSVNPKKVYAIDNGFIKANSVVFTPDHGRLLENIVYLHLRRLTTEIYYFSEKKECDFVVFEQKKITGVYQVCWQLDQDNMQREISGLQEAMFFFGLEKGTIITLDQTELFTSEGKTIVVQPFYEWVNSLNTG